MNSETKHWRSIDTAPADRDILIYVAAWGPLIARLNSEFREWTSRMQCPVSLAEETDRPTHWMPLPEPPTAGPPTSPSTIAPPSPAPARRRRSRGAENRALISLRQHEVRPPRRRLGPVDEDLEQDARSDPGARRRGRREGAAAARGAAGDRYDERARRRERAPSRAGFCGRRRSAPPCASSCHRPMRPPDSPSLASRRRCEEFRFDQGRRIRDRNRAPGLTLVC
jgi:hypothetical protein